MATGWAKIWLDPHLINARLEIWDQSYDWDDYIGKMVNPGWDHFQEPELDPYYMVGSPFPASHLYRIKFPRQQIDGVWYEKTQLSYLFTFQSTIEDTIPITVEPVSLIASIVEVNLPDQLYTGDSITGFVRVKNIGDGSGPFRCLITTEWNEAEYATEQTLSPGQILEATLPAGIIMPAQEASTTIRGQHLEDEVWVTDDIKTH